MPMKKTIIAAAAVMMILTILLVVILCLPTNDAEPEVTEPPTVQVMFDTNHVEHLEMLSFCYEGKETVSISRTKEGGWQITDRPGLPIDPVEVTLMLRGYERMLALRLVSESLDNPAEYGLDTPSLEVTVADHGSEKTYLFGDENKTYEGYYCTVKGSGAVYLLDVSYFTAFEKSVDSLLLVEKLPDLSAIPQVDWTSADGETPESTESLKGVLATLKIDRIVDYGREKFASYTLDRPAVGVLTLLDGSSLTLRFAKGETDELVYLLIGEGEIIYLVSCDNMSALLTYIG
jgi:hypothetical protein